MRLKQARIRKGLTQQQLGVMLGLEPNNASARMNQYERGKHAPDFATVKRMAELLGVPAAWFYSEDDLDASIIEAVHQLTDQQKQTLLAFIKQL